VTVEQALQHFQAAEVQILYLSVLKTDDALQPREGRMVPFKDKGRVESRSNEHVGTMRLALDAAQSVQLEPVWVADVDGQLLVVDGHHRLDAYRGAGRDTIPARTCSMTRQGAVLISKLVNCSARALEMHPEQRRDAAWQYLALVTRQGAEGLPKGESTRTVGGRFGMSHDTVARMLHQMLRVNPADWNPEALDAGTGFPRWRYVREQGAGWKDMKEKMDVEQITQHEAETLARKIGALIDKASPEAAERAMRMLSVESALERTNEDAQEFAEATIDGSDF
jgi:uncharacterized ParB-like nuclease family protein